MIPFIHIRELRQKSIVYIQILIVSLSSCYRQYDLRSPESSQSNPRNVLVNLNAHMGEYAEAKCLAINQLRPELFAVGANDPYVRMYDRRMLTPRSMKFPGDASSRC